jgi:two-component system chemotaxis response regulator CheB
VEDKKAYRNWTALHPGPSRLHSCNSLGGVLAVTTNMQRCNVIVIGASAGGVGSLTGLVGDLPESLAAAVAVALHVPAEWPSALPAILSRSGPLPAAHAQDGEPLQHGRIYVAPPGRHLLVKRRTVRAVNGPNENGHRPAVDPLFRTAARAHGRRTLGVVLSGSLDDGTVGLMAIKKHGGAALVQDPADALFSGMPASAIENVAVDFIGDVPSLANELVRRTAALAADHSEIAMTDDDAEELDVVEMDRGTPDPDDWAAVPSQFTCPECHGSLFEREDGALVRFRCRTGHAFSPETLAASQTQGVEEALWIALRALEENAALLHRLARRASDRGQVRAADRFLSQARGVEKRARVIRDALKAGSAVA